MSEKMKAGLQTISLTIGILIGVFGFVGSWAILPYRITAAEKEIAVIKARMDADHEALVRIEENVHEIRRILEKRISNP